MSFLPRLLQRTSFGARARSLPTLSRPIRSSSPAWPPIVSLPSRQLSSRPLSSLPPAVRRPRTSPIPELSRISWARPALGLRRYASFYGGGGSKRGQDPVGDMLSRFNQLDPMHLVFGLIGLNVAIFAGWQYASSSYQRFGDPSAFLAMGRHFTASLVNLKEGRVWSLITSCFSHSTTSHILMNMLSLYFCAPVVIGVVGNVSPSRSLDGFDSDGCSGGVHGAVSLRRDSSLDGVAALQLPVRGKSRLRFQRRYVPLPCPDLN